MVYRRVCRLFLCAVSQIREADLSAILRLVLLRLQIVGPHLRLVLRCTVLRDTGSVHLMQQ